MYQKQKQIIIKNKRNNTVITGIHVHTGAQRITLEIDKHYLSFRNSDGVVQQSTITNKPQNIDIDIDTMLRISDGHIYSTGDKVYVRPLKLIGEVLMKNPYKPNRWIVQLPTINRNGNNKTESFEEFELGSPKEAQ